jgi:hypothetical protein
LKSTLFISFLLFFSANVIAQDTLEIKGIVIDMYDSTQVLSSTKIFSDTSLVTQTNTKGEFSLQLTDKPALLRFDLTWYVPKEIQIDSSGFYIIKLKQYLFSTRHFYDSQKIILGPSYQFQNKAVGGNLHFSTPFINGRTLFKLNLNIYSGVSNYNFTQITSEIDNLFKHRYPYYLPNFELGYMRINSEQFSIEEGSLLLTDLNFGLPTNFQLGIQKIAYTYNSNNLERIGFSGGINLFIYDINSNIYLNTNLFDGLTTYQAKIETGIFTLQKYNNNISSTIGVRKIDKYLEISAGLRFSITYRKSYDTFYNDLNSYK